MSDSLSASGHDLKLGGEVMVELMNDRRSGELEMVRGDRRGSRWYDLGLLELVNPICVGRTYCNSV